MKWLFRRERASQYESAERRPLAWSTDLVALCSFVLVAAGVLILWNPSSPPLRALVGLPLLFVAPGYALVSVLFPHAGAGEGPTGVAGATDRVGRLTDTERIALSVGSSLALLPLICLPLASVAGFTSASVVAAAGGFVLFVAAAAWIRRRRLPPDRRYRPDLAGRLAGLRSFLFPRGSPMLAATNLALAVSVVLALTTGGYALLAPQDGERYTGMQLLSEDDSGELVAAGYPSEIDAGDSVSLTVAVENREGTDRTYDLVVLQEHYADGERLDREPVHRAEIDVADGETVSDEQTVTPTADDGRIRLVYLLYADGDVPADPTPENAYRYTHLWIDVDGDTLDLDPGDLPFQDDEGDSDDGGSDNESDSGDDEDDSGDGDDGSDDGGDGDSGDGDDGSGDGGDGDSGDGDDGSGDGGDGDSGDGDDGSGDGGDGDSGDGDDGSGDGGG